MCLCVWTKMDGSSLQITSSMSPTLPQSVCVDCSCEPKRRLPPLLTNQPTKQQHTNRLEIARAPVKSQQSHRECVSFPFPVFHNHTDTSVLQGMEKRKGGPEGCQDKRSRGHLLNTLDTNTDTDTHPGCGSQEEFGREQRLAGPQGRRC